MPWYESDATFPFESYLNVPHDPTEFVTSVSMFVLAWYYLGESSVGVARFRENNLMRFNTLALTQRNNSAMIKTTINKVMKNPKNSKTIIGSDISMYTDMPKNRMKIQICSIIHLSYSLGACFRSCRCLLQLRIWKSKTMSKATQINPGLIPNASRNSTHLLIMFLSQNISL